MSKYSALEKFLKHKQMDHVPMSFEEIESVIDDNLPPSARKYRAWWSNNPSNSVITYAWLNAGYKSAEVNLEGEKVVFRRQRAHAPEIGKSDETVPRHHPLFGSMKNSVTFAQNQDLTEPADPGWADAVENSGLCDE